MNVLEAAEEHTIPRDWVTRIDAAARALGLPWRPVLLRGWLGGTEFIGALRQLGGSLTPAPGFEGWVLAERGMAESTALKSVLPEYFAGDTGIGDFHGVMDVRLEDQRFLALRTEERVHNYAVRSALVLGGESREALLAFAAKVIAAHDALMRTTRRARVYGSSLRVPANQLQLAEADLTLPAGFKESMLGYLDGFWRAAGICKSLGLSPSRGVLLVGAPGTGKTQTIRHLLGRYPQCSCSVFMPTPDGAVPPERVFERMLHNIEADGRPAMVIVEDIDRLFDGIMTPQVFLNALDGLLQAAQPMLWIATSNDPSGLGANILDRPGRFDRIFVFELPGKAERRSLIQRFSPWPVAEKTLERIVDDSEGLSGAHLREVCLTAALAAAEVPATYGDELLVELDRVRQQHEQARRYDFSTGGRAVGFGKGVRVAEAGFGRPTSRRPLAR